MLPYNPNGLTHLRYSRGRGLVQTSKGIQMHPKEVLLAIDLFHRGKLLGLKIQGYTITQVDTDKKVIVAGCHTIPFSELEYIEREIKERGGRNA